MPESIRVGRIEELPDQQGRLVEANGKEIAVFRVGNEVYAFDNTCPHQGGPLSEGMIDGDQVVCPWHAWVFNVKTGTSPVAPQVRIATYKVRIDGSDVYVEF
jgi:NAD(P)H-dependent nitrite reductase small subunit